MHPAREQIQDALNDQRRLTPQLADGATRTQLRVALAAVGVSLTDAEFSGLAGPDLRKVLSRAYRLVSELPRDEPLVDAVGAVDKELIAAAAPAPELKPEVVPKPEQKEKAEETPVSTGPKGVSGGPQTTKRPRRSLRGRSTGRDK